MKQTTGIPDWQVKAPTKEELSCIIEAYALQHSKQSYTDGANSIHNALMPEIVRLQELVKAQKELIAWIERPTDGDELNMDWLIGRNKLANRIKELE